MLSRQRRVSIKVIFLPIFLSKNCILVSKCSEDIWIVKNRPVYFTSLLKRWGSGETHMTRGYISNVFFSKLSNHFINCQSFLIKTFLFCFLFCLCYSAADRIVDHCGSSVISILSSFGGKLAWKLFLLLSNLSSHRCRSRKSR